MALFQAPCPFHELHESQDRETAATSGCEPPPLPAKEPAEEPNEHCQKPIYCLKIAKLTT